MWNQSISEELTRGLLDAWRSLPQLGARLEEIQSLLKERRQLDSLLELETTPALRFLDIGLVFQGQLFIFENTASLDSFRETFYPPLQLGEDYEFIDELKDLPLGLSHDYPEQTRINHDNFPLFEFDMSAVPKMELFTLWFPNDVQTSYRSKNVLDRSFALTLARADAFGWMPGTIYGTDNYSVLSDAQAYRFFGQPVYTDTRHIYLSPGNIREGMFFTLPPSARWSRPPTEPMTTFLNYQVRILYDKAPEYLPRKGRLDEYYNSFYYHAFPDFSQFVRLPLDPYYPGDNSFYDEKSRMFHTTRNNKKPCRVRHMPRYINYKFNSTGKQLDIGCPEHSHRRLVIKIKKTRPIDVRR